MIEIIEGILKQFLKNSQISFQGKIKFATSPTINIGTNRRFEIMDTNGNYLKNLPEFPSEFFDIEIKYFKEKASKRIANCLEFMIENGQITEVKEYWDEQIVIDFNNNLPKSKRGKIKPWYDSEEVWEQYLQKQKKL